MFCASRKVGIRLLNFQSLVNVASLYAQNMAVRGIKTNNFFFYSRRKVVLNEPELQDIHNQHSKPFYPPKPFQAKEGAKPF